MSENFGIGFGLKIAVAVLDQLILQRLVIFDDAIVDEGNFAGGVEMRVGILVVHLSVRGPARVADSVAAGGRTLGHEPRQISDATGAFAGFHLIAVNDGDPGGIVAAIFEAPQTVQENGSRFRTANVTDNSAHG